MVPGSLGDSCWKVIWPFTPDTSNTALTETPGGVGRMSVEMKQPQNVHTLQERHNNHALLHDHVVAVV